MNKDVIILALSNRMIIGQLVEDTEDYIILDNVLTINGTVRDDKHIIFGQLKYNSNPVTFKNYEYKSKAKSRICELYNNYLKEKSYE